MLRIDETSAQGARDALVMARSALKAGKTDAADIGIATAIDFLGGLEPSRAPRGRARADSLRHRARGQKPASQGTPSVRAVS